MSVFKGNFAELKAVSWGVASPGTCSPWSLCARFNLEAGFGRRANQLGPWVSKHISRGQLRAGASPTAAQAV